MAGRYYSHTFPLCYTGAHMKHHTTLFFASSWIILISLLAIPRGIKSILVILGAGLVFLVAYSMLQKKRRREASLHVEPVEKFLDKTADEIVETIMKDEVLLADARHDAEDLARDLVDVIGEVDSIASPRASLAHTADPLAQSLYRDAEVPRARKPRRKKEVEDVTPHDESGFTI